MNDEGPYSLTKIGSSSGLSRRKFLAFGGIGVTALVGVNSLVKANEAEAQIWIYCVTFISSDSVVLFWPSCLYITWAITICTLYGVVTNYAVDVKEAHIGWC